MPIRTLVTGFSVFPGAPVNSSERLVRMLHERRPDFGAGIVLETAVLETAYKSAGNTFAQLSLNGSPDIAILFGLSRNARGFRLERSAKNVVSLLRPDATGYLPESPAICDGPDCHASSLPLDDIHRTLTMLGLPVEFSEDTGDYLCNFTFYNARAGRFQRFQPEICGFVHIPYLDYQLVQVPGGEALPRLTDDQLWTGALAIIDACISAKKSATEQQLQAG